jgi:hypothetical protein
MRKHRTPRGTNNRSPALKVEALEDRSLLSLSGTGPVADRLVSNEAAGDRSPSIVVLQEQFIGTPPVSGKTPASGLPVVLESFVVVEFRDLSIPSMFAQARDWESLQSETLSPVGNDLADRDRLMPPALLGVDPLKSESVDLSSWWNPTSSMLHEAANLERGRPNYASNPLRPPVPPVSTDTVASVFSQPSANDARRVAPVSNVDPAGDAGTARMVTLPAGESRVQPPPININIGVPLPSDGHSGSSRDVGQLAYSYRAIAVTSAELTDVFTRIYVANSSGVADTEESAGETMLPVLSGGLPSNIFSVDVVSLERAIDRFVEDVSAVTPAAALQPTHATYTGWFVAGIIATAVGLELRRRRPRRPLFSLDADSDYGRPPNLSDFRTDSCP